MKRVRKAVVAAVATGAGVLFAGMTSDMPADEGQWAALIGKALGAAFVAGYAVWRVPNSPS